MPQVQGQYNAANPQNLLVGEATLWYAPYTPGQTPTAPPGSTVTLGTAWPSPWVTPGATESGVIWSVDEKDTDLTIDEQPNPAMVVADTQDYMFDVTLAEDTLANMLFAYGRGSIASTAPTGGRTDTTCGLTSGSATVTDTACVATDVGKGVSGTGVPYGTTVVSVTAATSFVMSAAATVTGTESLEIGGTGGFETLTFSITKNMYTFGLEGTNAYNKPRRIYIPYGVVAGTKVDTTYQRAKTARLYKTSLRALCPPSQIDIVEFTS